MTISQQAELDKQIIRSVSLSKYDAFVIAGALWMLSDNMSDEDQAYMSDIAQRIMDTY